MRNNLTCSLPLMPAERHFATASGTAALGGSIMDMRPTNRMPVIGASIPGFTSNTASAGKKSPGKVASQNPSLLIGANWIFCRRIHYHNKTTDLPRTRSPRAPKSEQASWKASLQFWLIGHSFPSTKIVEQHSKMRSGAPFISITYRGSLPWLQ